MRFAIELENDFVKFNITGLFADTELYHQAREEEGAYVSEVIDQYTTQHLKRSTPSLLLNFLLHHL